MEIKSCLLTSHCTELNLIHNHYSYQPEIISELSSVNVILTRSEQKQFISLATGEKTEQQHGSLLVRISAQLGANSVRPLIMLQIFFN